ncbi:uncharacterized protein LOC116344013 [Contarinia nasturtii]|uniref:uncharacterized protein LOC116344013 n=1 Tax=Contarinia nasturtii TaxID=265458 RepID=UPI0012D46156|nr:uncharacterized protein LOC116344013 [Contarinia nasturtii]
MSRTYIVCRYTQTPKVSSTSCSSNTKQPKSNSAVSTVSTASSSVATNSSNCIQVDLPQSSFEKENFGVASEEVVKNTSDETGQSTNIPDLNSSYMKNDEMRKTELIHLSMIRIHEEYDRKVEELRSERERRLNILKEELKNVTFQKNVLNLELDFC